MPTGTRNAGVPRNSDLYFRDLVSETRTQGFKPILLGYINEHQCVQPRSPRPALADRWRCEQQPTGPQRKRLLRNLKIAPGMRILDLGCGASDVFCAGCRVRQTNRFGSWLLFELGNLKPNYDTRIDCTGFLAATLSVRRKK
jgi:hypothetical protein